MRSIRAYDGKLTESWYIAARSEDVRPGRALARLLYGKPYALFRSTDGTVRTLEDRCLHRGAKLSEGTCDGATLRCPYHGWAYGGDGRVIDIPSEGPRTPELERAVAARAWKIASLPTVEREGVVWVWLGEDANGNPSTPVPAAPPWNFPFAADRSWTSYFMVTDFRNEVTELAQNFMDVPHTVFVHAKWFRDKAFLRVPYHLETGRGRVKATYIKPRDAIGGFMRRIINPQSLDMEHTDEFIFPNLTRVDYRFGTEHGFIINSQCTPVDRFQTRVYTWIAYRGSAFAPFFRPLIRFYTRRVITQDVAIMRNQGDNLRLFSELDEKNGADQKSTAADEILLAIARLREVGRERAVDPFTLPAKVAEDRAFWI